MCQERLGAQPVEGAVFTKMPAHLPVSLPQMHQTFPQLAITL
jgi:hypothetical protein